jgi:hypothetical protein
MHRKKQLANGLLVKLGTSKVHRTPRENLETVDTVERSHTNSSSERHFLDSLDTMEDLSFGCGAKGRGFESLQAHTQNRADVF